MKKYLSLLMAIILAVSVFSIGAYADEPAPPDFSSLNAELLFTSSEHDPYTLYIKNGKYLMKGMKISETINISINVLLDGTFMYLYLPIFPFIHVKFDVSDSMPKLEDFESVEYTFIKSYNKKIGSVTYYVEEYYVEDGIIKYYYLDGKLKFLESQDEYSTSAITVISTNVDDKIFEIPFYSINITFLFNLIFNNHII